MSPNSKVSMLDNPTWRSNEQKNSPNNSIEFKLNQSLDRFGSELTIMESSLYEATSKIFICTSFKIT